MVFRWGNERCSRRQISPAESIEDDRKQVTKVYLYRTKLWITNHLQTSSKGHIDTTIQRFVTYGVEPQMNATSNST